VRHSHLDFIEPVRITCFDDALPLADIAKEMPHATLLVMLLSADGVLRDTLQFAKGGRRPVETVEFVCRYLEDEDASVLVATSRGAVSALLRREEDLRAWRAMAKVVEKAGLQLLDWFIVGGGWMFVPSELSDVPGGW